MKIRLTYFLFALFVFVGCKKSTKNSAETSPNWNAKYVGQYKGTWTSCPYGSLGSGPLTTKDTVLSIWADSDPMKNSISLSNVGSAFQFDENNNVSIYHGYITFKRSVETSGPLPITFDSLFYACANGGLGGGINETFKGKKL